jgi:RNA recognition motif-containing protein
MNGKTILGQELYVKEALSKKERDEEKKKEQIYFKNSKRRCNLYVKNFPPDTKTEELRLLFIQFGPIESIKIFPKEEEGLYAFVTYENPE